MMYNSLAKAPLVTISLSSFAAAGVRFYFFAKPATLAFFLNVAYCITPLEELAK